MLFIPNPKLTTNFPRFLSQLCGVAIEGSPTKIKDTRKINLDNVIELKKNSFAMELVENQIHENDT